MNNKGDIKTVVILIFLLLFIALIYLIVTGVLGNVVK